MRLTSYHNLSALVTCHTLYVVFTTWQSAVFLVNSRLTHFTATYLRRHPFFRSYGARLPSSLTRFHSRALAKLCPPTCVGFRYGQPWEHTKFFSVPALMDPLQPRPPRPCSCEQTATFNRRPVSTHVSQLNLTTAGAGILNLLSIVYALRPRLRSRLTLGGRTFPRKPWVYGGQEFNLSYRYSCLHPHFLTLHTFACYQARLPLCFNALRTLPTNVF